MCFLIPKYVAIIIQKNFEDLDYKDLNTIIKCKIDSFLAKITLTFPSLKSQIYQFYQKLFTASGYSPFLHLSLSKEGNKKFFFWTFFTFNL